MRTYSKIITTLCLIFGCAYVCFASDVSRKYLEVELYDYDWEANMAVLDGFSYELQNESPLIGYIIVYGSRRSRRGEIQRRIECMRHYMSGRRGGSPANRIVIVDGGYRERSMMELWVVPHGERLPAPTPTVNSRDVRLRRGRIRYSCEI